jgi:hypothetical protein
MLAPLNVQFQTQRKVVGDKYTTGTAIAAIFKYKQEHGNIDVPKAYPHKHQHRRIINTKTASKKSIQQSYGNPQFAMSHLLSLSKLSLIELPTGYIKLATASTKPNAPMKKKVKAAIVAPTLVAVPKANAPISAIVLPPKALPKKKKSMMIFPAQTRSSPRRTNALLPVAVEHQGTSFHSVLIHCCSWSPITQCNQR